MNERSIKNISDVLEREGTMVYFFIFFIVIGVVVTMYINLHPVLGGNITKEQKEQFSKLENYKNGKFINQVPTKIQMKPSDMLSMMKESNADRKKRKPAEKITIPSIDWDKINSDEDSVTWFGHSAFLLSMDKKKILVDPMLGQVASPVSFAGSRRYSDHTLSIIDEMPHIDAVLITHDHYDHLDYPSIKKLKGKVTHFFVPNGVSAHLLRWGVGKEQITEFNWWDEAEFQGLTLAFTPSKHFSGRGIFNRDTTLWGGWVVLGNQTRFYTSGDGGYGAHFKEIGKKYGPFDITLMEGGQYDKRWSWVHMTPEESVQAHLDVNGKNMMLIHWGGFTLANHGWAEPVERAIIATKQKEVNQFAPRIGGTISLQGKLSIPSYWWESYC